MKFSKNKKDCRSKKGFSLIEVLIAIFILSVGMVSVMLVMGKQLKESTDARNEMVAAGLAQESVELARNVRDGNILNSVSPFTNLADGIRCISSRTSDLNPAIRNRNSTAVDCQSPYVLRKGTYGYVTYVTGTVATKFKRKSVLSPDASSGGKQIISYVWWGSVEPAATVDCTLGNKCVYTSLILAATAL